MITKITKRNGESQDWDLNRITKAAFGAITEARNIDKHDESADGHKNAWLDAEKVADSVQEMAEATIAKYGQISVEEVQDAVEMSLYRNGHHHEAKAFILYRSKHDSLRFAEHDQSLIRDYLLTAKYSRYNKDKKRRETWDEVVDRVKGMHLRYFADKNIYSEIDDAFEAVRRFEVMPSMRSLQFGGEAIEVNNARMFNCSFTHVDRVEVFRETMWLLLAGSGVGFSVQRKHVDRLPQLAHRADEYALPVVHHKITDTIEGWGNAVHELITSYVNGYYVEFDYSLIRTKGTPLKTSGGRAPGHLGLKNALEKSRSILANASGRKLRPIEAYDILMFCAKAVLSGGIRRSATICLFSADDDEMMNAKTGKWFEENLQRSASNNSAVVLRGHTTKEAYDKLFECQKQFGEPGFYFVEDLEYGGNPCVEIGLNPSLIVTEENVQEINDFGISAKVGDRLSGVQMCNLTTINAAKIKTQEEFLVACRRAALIGTLQAAYTKMPYLGKVTEYINRREALLGVSICGILDNPKILLVPENLQDGAKAVKDENVRVAGLIQINSAARTTCVKPEGTASLILGTSSGVHPHHAKRYFRRVQANRSETIYNFFKKHNPDACELSVYSPTDDFITFCIESKEDAILLGDVKAIDFLEIVKTVQQNWVVPGTGYETHSPGLYHNVSNTTVVDSEDWDSVRDYIWDNQKLFTGISLLSRTGDKDYPQAPREEVKTNLDIAKWNELKYRKVDYTQCLEKEDNTSIKETVACAGGACEIV